MPTAIYPRMTARKRTQQMMSVQLLEQERHKTGLVGQQELVSLVTNIPTLTQSEGRAERQTHLFLMGPLKVGSN